MNNRITIEQLAWNKFAAAKELLALGFFDDAYYLGGYTIELLLKSCICKAFKIEGFFDEKGVWIKKFKYPQTFKSHDFESLMILAGLYSDLIAAADKNHLLKRCWSVVGEWNEESRYVISQTKEYAENFLISIIKIAEWIQESLLKA